MTTTNIRSSARSTVLATAFATAVALASATAASAAPVTHPGGLTHSLGSSSPTIGAAPGHQEQVAVPDDALAPARFRLTSGGADAARLVAAPAARARSAQEATAYVTGSGTVTPIRTATNTAGPPITVGDFPIGIAITPNGRTAYVTNWYSGTVTPIRTATNTAGTPITVGHDPDGIAITPNGRTAYVTNFNSGTVTPIRTATNTAGTPIRVGRSPYGIAITP